MTGAEDTERDDKVELGEDGLPLPPKKRKRRTKAELVAGASSSSCDLASSD